MNSEVHSFFNFCVPKKNFLMDENWSNNYNSVCVWQQLVKKMIIYQFSIESSIEIKKQTRQEKTKQARSG